MLRIHGDQDTIVSYNVALDTYGRIPQAHIVTIPGGTHLIVATHGQEIGRAVAQFIKETNAHEFTNDQPGQRTL